jgi:hypothetical protein
LHLRFVLVFSILPAYSLAGVIATASSLDYTCSPVVDATNPVHASASLSCSGASAGAVADSTPYDPSGDYVLRVYGSKEHDVPRIESAARFDDWLLVTGTEQSGYLLVMIDWGWPELSQTMATPYRVQGLYRDFMGNLIPGDYAIAEQQRFNYVPFTAGVPAHIYGGLYGYAGARDIFRQNGDYESTMTVYIRITSEMVADPTFSNQVYIPGASYVTIPEPACWWLMCSGLLVITRFRGRRK